MTHKSLIFIFSLAITTFITGCSKPPVAEKNSFSRQLQSNKALFNLIVETEDQQTLLINQFQNWIITVTDNNGAPVYPAAFAITGGMPSHGHGLPTQPLVTDYLGDGKYRLEGLKFTMDGAWTLQLQILSGDLQDSAQLNFDVSY